VGRNQSVKRWADQCERWKRGESSQHSPAGKLGQDPPPGGKSFEQRSVAVPHPNGPFVVCAGHRQINLAGFAEVDESNPSNRSTKLTPFLGGLTQGAVAVHPHVQR